jgi:predicted aldo/keto reductase-like oxidoreductase
MAVKTHDVMHHAFLILVEHSGNTSLSSQGSGEMRLSVATLGSLKAAERLVSELIAQGISQIELSASFGAAGEAAVRTVVADSGAERTVMIGRVRFAT